MPNTSRTVRYQYYRSTQNYHIYWETNADGTLVAAGMPKERYAMNCRPEIYLPHAIFPDRSVAVSLTFMMEGK